MTLAFIVVSLLFAQQPARDVSASQRAGTASITGRVVADSPNREPVRRSRVTLSSTDGTVARSDVTDDNGAFVFRDLPAARYSLAASKSAWLTTNYGATRPGRPGTPIVVADGARVNGITVRMAHGSAITGVVRGPDGEPVAGVKIQVGRLTTRNGQTVIDSATHTGSVFDTDDTGTYRAFGLAPGDFVVFADAGASMFNSIRNDGGLFSRMTGAPDQTVASAPVKFAVIFYPGTTDPAAASVISLGAGEERSGIDLALQIVPTSRVDGIVTDVNGVPQTRSSVIAISGGHQAGNVIGLYSALTSSTDRTGHYQLSGLAPGEYTLLSSGDKTWAETSLFIDASGQDRNVPLTLQPLLKMTGRAVFDGGARPELRGLRYSLVSMDAFASLTAQGLGGSVNTLEATFENQIVPGTYQLAFSGVPAGWYLKSAIARGRDTLDVPVTIGPNDRLTEFVVTFTDTPSELSGSLADAGGRPASEYFVVVFSTDRQFWTEPSRRVVQVRPASDGAFSIKGLPAGEYFVSALTDIEPGEPLSAELLESILAAATPVRVTIVDGQRTVQALRIGG